MDVAVVSHTRIGNESDGERKNNKEGGAGGNQSDGERKNRKEGGAGKGTNDNKEGGE